MPFCVRTTRLNILTDQIDWFKECIAGKKFCFKSFDLGLSQGEIYQHCVKNQIDMVLCLQYQNIKKHAFSHQTHNIPWLMPTGDGAKMEDKVFAHQWFVNNGYEAILPKVKKTHEFPYLLKMANSRGGERVHFIQNETALKSHYPLAENHILQTYIDSPYEYAFHFIAQRGDILIHETYQHDFSKEQATLDFYIRGIRGRNKKASPFIMPKQYLSVLQDILKKLSYSGFGCFDIKIKHRDFYIIELNSRMGGSLVFYNHELHDFSRFCYTYYQAIKNTQHMP